jgi:hypothetical protein
MSALRDTNEQIRAGQLAQQRRRAEQARALLPIRIVDALIAELEELHLAGRKRVPETFDARLAAFQTMCPQARGCDLRSRITIVHLMDQLYQIQEQLLETKAGRSWGAGGDDRHLSRAS